MERDIIINKTKEFLSKELTGVYNQQPMLKLVKPFIDTIISNNIEKADKFLAMLEDKDGKIDTSKLLNDFTDNLLVSDNTSINSPLGNVTFGEGKIVLPVPFTGKNIVFNKDDISKYKNYLLNEQA